MFHYIIGTTDYYQKPLLRLLGITFSLHLTKYRDGVSRSFSVSNNSWAFVIFSSRKVRSVLCRIWCFRSNDWRTPSSGMWIRLRRWVLARVFFHHDDTFLQHNKQTYKLSLIFEKRIGLACYQNLGNRWMMVVEWGGGTGRQASTS